MSTTKYKTMFKIGRPINGISLNGLEYALNEQDEIMIFETPEQARQFLSDNGCADEDLDYYTLEEVNVPAVLLGEPEIETEEEVELRTYDIKHQLIMKVQAEDPWKAMRALLDHYEDDVKIRIISVKEIEEKKGDQKNRSIRHMLDLVIGDYLSVLADAVEGGEMDKDNYNTFIDGLYEIGEVFDINVHDFDVDNLLIGRNK